jgi:beta-galactosidase
MLEKKGIGADMKKFPLDAVAAALLASSCVATSSPREVDSFNDGWKFARFGPMPDGSYLKEPGGKTPNYKVGCSSEAMERNGAARHVLDEDPGTCWNSAAKNGQWVSIEFDESRRIAGTWVKWGFAGAPGIAVSAKIDGEWKTVVSLPDNKRDGDVKVAFKPVDARGIKIELIRMPKKGWPRIAEIEIYDDKGRKLEFGTIENGGGSPAEPAFDDVKWKNTRLPHDWAIEGPFRRDLDNSTGALPWRGIGWYRKAFEIPAPLEGKRVYLDFDGAMANAKVYLNGKLVGGWPYGYNSFRVDLTPALRFGGKNVLAVRLDTVHWGSRWYPGAGIYRNTRLVVTEPVHVAHWGVAVTTPRISSTAATADFAVSIDNDSNKSASVSAEVAIVSPEGAVVAESSPETLAVPAGKTAAAKLSVDIPKPMLWSLNAPNLYKAVVRIKSDGELVDEYPVTFGIRTIEATPRDGFKLNGRRVEIKGVCNHHDLGPLGAAVNKRALERQLEILKEMGCNAIRTSHNPPAPELLDLCDRMGFLVVDEAFDCWKRGKRPYDYSALFDEWKEKDLKALVDRDRNHPSVIIWSIGNEVPDQGNAKMAKELRDIVHRLDPTRPVVLCVNSGRVGLTPVAQAVDIMGYNYNLGCYPKFFARPENAGTPLLGSETASCISTRGIYFFPIEKNKRADFQITSYDTYYPGWGCTPDRQFQALDEFPATLGEFVWTGFDYLGEPTPYNGDATVLLNFSDPKERARQKKELDKIGRIAVPSRSSYFGILDLCGFPKDRFYAYQARWRTELPMVHILPHWNWPGRVGKTTPVHVYTSGDEAELFLNGKSLGRKKKGPKEYRLRWDEVKYQPGELKAVAYKNGKKWAETTVKTSDAPATLSLSPDRPEIKADGEDLSFVTLRVLDANGIVVPTAAAPVEFSIDGPGEIVATGNGDPTNRIPFGSKKRPAFNGLALVVIRSIPGKTGTITLEARSPGLKPAKTAISAE